MMDQERQLRLQAYFDGEPPGKEAREVAESLARDAEAWGLVGEFKQTRDALAGFEEELKLPESRDFFWSKIQRQIERQELREPALEPALTLAARLRRLLVPLTSVAMLAMLVFVSVRQEDSSGSETTMEDPGTCTKHNFNTGTSLVWLSYRA